MSLDLGWGQRGAGGSPYLTSYQRRLSHGDFKMCPKLYSLSVPPSTHLPKPENDIILEFWPHSLYQSQWSIHVRLTSKVSPKYPIYLHPPLSPPYSKSHSLFSSFHATASYLGIQSFSSSASVHVNFFSYLLKNNLAKVHTRSCLSL